jgi:hypothetical protein
LKTQKICLILKCPFPQFTKLPTTLLQPSQSPTKNTLNPWYLDQSVQRTSQLGHRLFIQHNINWQKYRDWRFFSPIKCLITSSFALWHRRRPFDANPSKIAWNKTAAIVWQTYRWFNRMNKYKTTKFLYLFKSSSIIVSIVSVNCKLLWRRNATEKWKKSRSR